jgi:hypothetical protein
VGYTACSGGTEAGCVHVVSRQAMGGCNPKRSAGSAWPAIAAPPSVPRVMDCLGASAFVHSPPRLRSDKFTPMADGPSGNSQLEQALAGGTPHPTGWFRLFFDDERWEWSPEVERLHGYEPGTTQPTTNRVLSHNLSFAVCPVLLVLCERYLWRDRRVAVIRR